MSIFKKQVSVEFLAETLASNVSDGFQWPTADNTNTAAAPYDIETTSFLFAMHAHAVMSSGLNDSSKAALMAALAARLAHLSTDPEDIRHRITFLNGRLNNYFCDGEFGKNNPTHITTIDGVHYINPVAKAASYFLLLKGVPENDARILVWHRHNLQIAISATKFLDEMSGRHTVDAGAFKRSTLQKLSIELHEPIEVQRQELITYCRRVGFEELEAAVLEPSASCDALPDGEGTFGTLSNPIPVNGLLGEIKYLSKLRSLTGVPFFFHRIGSFASSATEESVDGYEIVSVDGVHWGMLYFDFYHPRRSKFAPPGMLIKPYNAELGEDPLAGLGVNQRVNPFPMGLPVEIAEFYPRALATKLAATAKDLLDKRTFIRPERQ